MIRRGENCLPVAKSSEMVSAMSSRARKGRKQERQVSCSKAKTLRACPVANTTLKRRYNDCNDRVYLLGSNPSIFDSSHLFWKIRLVYVNSSSKE